MRRETSAGIKAGALINALFFLWPFVAVLGFDGIPTGYSFDLAYIMIGFLVLLVVSVIVGGVLGLMFAVLIDRLPLRSTYSKALVLCFCLWIVFVAAIPTRIIIDLFVLAGFMIESVCFAYLYSKWTRKT